MDELELRIAAVELFLIEVHAWADPQALDDAERSIRASLDGGDADEKMIRLGAIKLIEDARDRFKPDGMGFRPGS